MSPNFVVEVKHAVGKQIQYQSKCTTITAQVKYEPFKISVEEIYIYVEFY